MPSLLCASAAYTVVGVASGWNISPPPYEWCQVFDVSPVYQTRPVSANAMTPNRTGIDTGTSRTQARSATVPKSDESPAKRWLRKPRLFRLPMYAASNHA